MICNSCVRTAYLCLHTHNWKPAIFYRRHKPSITNSSLHDDLECWPQQNGFLKKGGQTSLETTDCMSKTWFCWTLLACCDPLSPVQLHFLPHTLFSISDTSKAVLPHAYTVSEGLRGLCTVSHLIWRFPASPVAKSQIFAPCVHLWDSTFVLHKETNSFNVI